MIFEYLWAHGQIGLGRREGMLEKGYHALRYTRVPRYAVHESRCAWWVNGNKQVMQQGRRRCYC